MSNTAYVIVAGPGWTRQDATISGICASNTTKTQRLIGFWLHLENVFADFEFAVAATSLQNGEVTWGLLTFLVADLHGRSEGPAWLIDILLPLARMGGKVQ